MSLAGLKKQINKANQYVSERVGTAEATKLDEEYHEMEKKIDVTNELVEDLLTKTREYLQPNPATRAKMATVSTISKLRGSSKTMPYPQQEGILGESMLKYGKLLDSPFGTALVDAGEAFKQMADIKYGLEDTVKQNFLDPLTHLQSTDLKEVIHHRKKLEGRRLDYDCKRRKQVKDQRSYDEELRQAVEKLEESKKLAETAMYNVLENDVEQVSQLSAFVDAQLDFHRQTTQILEGLADKLKERVSEAGSRSRTLHIPKPVITGDRSPGSRSPAPESPQLGGVTKTASSGGAVNHQDPWSSAGQESWSQQQQQAPPAYSQGSRDGFANGAPAVQKPCCKALYDFDAENEGELSFKEGQTINLIAQIDENWYEGSLPNGHAGVFPVSYVQVVVPL